MAKINGQLERAQLEQIVGASGTPTVRGRVYADITNPAAAVPMFCDGTVEKQLAFVETPQGVVANNSGKAVTVNWANSTTQVVTLTDNCIISFSNPQANEIHTLLVRQAGFGGVGTAGTIYNYKLNMGDQDPVDTQYQPIGSLATAKTRTHKWLYRAQVTPGYSTTVPFATMNPQALPATLATGIDIHPSGACVSMGRTSSPFTTFYTLYGPGPLGSYSAYGFQALTPVAAAAQANNVKYSLDGKLLFLSSGTTPFLQGFNLQIGGAPMTGGALANPGVLPTGAGQCVDVHPSGMFVGIGHTTTPFMSVYPTDNSAYGTKLTNPAALPSAQVNSIAFAPTGDFLAAATQTTPFIHVWAFAGNNTGAGAIGALCVNPGVLPSGGPAGALGKGIAWRPQGDYIAMANTTTPFIYVIAFDRATATFGAVVTPATPPGAATTSVQWSLDGNFLIVGGGTSGFLYVYDFSALTLGAPLAVTGAAPVVQVNDIAVHPSNNYFLLALNASPFTVGYAMPSKDRNYLKLLE